MKYKLESPHPELDLYRVVALKDFGDVKAGDVGGWVASEENLSHFGNCWVFDDAMVFENARVSSNAMVRGKCLVFGDAKVRGNCVIHGHCRVSEDAFIGGNAEVFNAEVCGRATICADSRVIGGWIE